MARSLDYDIIRSSTILVVEDHAASQSAIVDCLERQGFSTVAVADGESALEQARHRSPELIVLDVNLPGINGWTVCSRLKADPRTQTIPVIFTTAFVDPQDRVRGFAHGGVDYLVKPIDPAELIARLVTHLQVVHWNRQLQAENERLRRQAEELAAAKEQAEHRCRLLHQWANIDELTQLANRRRLETYLPQVWTQLRCDRLPLSVLLCDIDAFKAYNDCYGHPQGDRCLQQVAQVLQSCMRSPVELVARYGGEEFIVVLPYANRQEALRRAQQLQEALQQADIPHLKSPIASRVTMSLGLCSQVPDEQATPADMIAIADRALYRAKLLGRNRIESMSAPCGVGALN